ncbi:MAG: helix-turn-helix domain-containing protein [Litoreibacter sp.]|uniref:MarR family winged helix-turn-helix transcriptional regulator n=1 Tax=Litoreibacter sp. TaxID=1969459 RepID=UPI003297E88E
MEHELNPTQDATLGYLVQANKFSRIPSQVAAYLGATRRTTSQTLKSLLRKGYVEKVRSTQDKRVISYDLSPRQEFLGATRQAARMMEMDSPKGYQVSVILSYWFGTSYYADPLFPWIKEKILEKNDPDSKADHVLAYAVKRLNKTKGMRENVL